MGNTSKINTYEEPSDRILINNLEGPMAFAFDITSACNYKCLHCYNDSGKKLEDELNKEELLDVARQIAEFKCTSVCLCGGEPLISPYFFDVVDILAENCGVLNFVSNGCLIRENVVKKIKRKGINVVQISLDGINEMQHDTFRGYPGAFKKAIEALKLLNKYGIETAVSTIPNKLNYKSISKLVNICVELGVSNIRSMPLIPEGRGGRIQELLLTPEEYQEYVSQLMILKEECIRKNVIVEWGDPLDHFWRMPKLGKKGVRTHTAEVKSNGDLAVSTYIPIVVGNIREHSLKEYWDCGYDKIWTHPMVMDYINKIENIYDINNLTPKPYAGEKYYIPLIS